MTKCLPHKREVQYILAAVDVCSTEDNSVLYSPVEGPVLHFLESLEIHVNKFYI